MGRAWEYAQLYFSCDPGSSDASVKAYLNLPGDDEWQQLGEVASTLKIVNGLGADGWEMVGSPVSENSVFTYQAANDTWHDRAYWVERIYWFKREAPG